MIVKVLMVDDHQMMIEGYKYVLSLNDKYTIEATTANDCETAYKVITNPSNQNTFELAFLDYSLPPYLEEKIHSGEDLALLIRKYMPNTKIIILTTHFDAIKLYTIVKKVQPNALVVKSDFEPQQLIEIFNEVMEGNTYYSELVHQRIKERLFSQGLLDSIDRQIIVLISEGFHIKSIATHLNVSDDTIKKRKSKIKDLLGIERGSDEDILKECRLLGLL